MAATLQLRSHKLTVRPWSIMLVLLCLVGIYFLLPQLGALRRSLELLSHANPFLISIAVLLTAADVILSGYAQLLAASHQGKFSDILIRELAGAFLNHFLPYSVGIVTLIEEYYRKITRNRAYAYIVATIPVFANFAISIIALVLISPITISYIGTQIGDRFPEWMILVLIVAAACIATAAILYQQKIVSIIRETVHTIRTHDPKAIAATVAVVFLQIIINTATLWAVAQSLGMAIPVIDMFILILASNFTGNAAPTPGGIAVAEATLVVGMTSIGLSLPDAVAVTLLFRFVTFWLELLPGGWALARLRSA